MTRKLTAEYISEHFFSEDRLEYTLAIGRLTILWADVEAELYRVLTTYSGIDNNIARVVFTGLRAKAMMEKILLIAKNTNMEPERIKDIEFVFPQIKIINTMRDRIIHGSTSSYAFPKDRPQSTVISNYTRSSRLDNYYEHIVDAESMYFMMYDLMAIHNHLNRHWGSIRGNFTFKAWEENPGEPTTWLYKYPAPIKRQD